MGALESRQGVTRLAKDRAPRATEVPMSRRPVTETLPTAPRTSRRRAPLLLALGLVSSLLSGCIVNAGTSDGTIRVFWAVGGGCDAQGIESLRILLDRNGVGTTTSTNCSQSGSATIRVEPGTYVPTVEALNSAGGVVLSTTGNAVSVGSNDSVDTGVIQLGQAAGTGTLDVTWTLDGQSPATACSAQGVTHVVASVLNEAKDQVLAQSTQVSCEAGAASVTGIPAGAVYVQLDAYLDDGGGPPVLLYGTWSPFGPLTVKDGALTNTPTPVDMQTLRATVSLRWGAIDGETCGGAGISEILVEIRGSDDALLIPLDDPAVSKPCDLSVDSAQSDRLIDLQFVTPNCTVPADAEALVICGVVQANLTVTLYARDAQGQIAYRGGVPFTNIPYGAHIPVQDAVQLAPCNAATNPCPNL
jgi:hypothetical protein